MTERRNHARDHVKAMKGDVAGQWDGMVVIGGDGLLYEVINVREDDALPSVLPFERRRLTAVVAVRQGLWERDPEGMSALRCVPRHHLKNRHALTLIH